MEMVNTTGFTVSASEFFPAHKSGCRSDRQEVAEMLGSCWVPCQSFATGQRSPGSKICCGICVTDRKLLLT